MADCVCVLCHTKKKKTPQEFELVCSACEKGPYGVCRSCYARDGPPPGTPFPRVLAYAWRALGSDECHPWRRCEFDDGEVFILLEELCDIGLERMTQLHKRDRDARQRRRRSLLLLAAMAAMALIIMGRYFY